MKPRRINKIATQQFELIQDYISKTNLVESSLSKNLFIKTENNQLTGSFKIRGATSKLLQLKANSVSRVITASTGNHGLAVATIGKRLGIDVKVFVPDNITKSKEQKLKDIGVELVYIAGDSDKSEITARKTSEKESIPFISPYNDEYVIAGQASIAMELEQQISLDDVDAIYITIGGGGLIGGIGSILREKYPHIEIIGCQPKNSATMFHSVRAGRVVTIEHQPTLSDGSAGGIEEGSITFPLAKEIIDRYILVKEEEIKNAIYQAFIHHNAIIEGSAGVALAAYLKNTESDKNKKQIVVWCGGNIEPLKWYSIISDFVSKKE